MNGDKIFMILFRVPNDKVGELRFVEFDFTASTATGVLLNPEYIDVHLPSTVFMGSETMTSTNGGITIY